MPPTTGMLSNPRGGMYAALALLGCAAMPASALADQGQPVADLAVPADGVVPTVAAHDGRVVWSTYDRTHGVWRLMEGTAGTVRAVPVEPRRAPFDVDLGRAADGSTVAVYSRCEREDCDVYAYSFSRARERRLGLNTRADETSPAVWGSRVAFVRSGEGAARPMWALARGRRARPLASPPSHHRAAISQLDMRGSSVVYRWTSANGSFIRFASTAGRGGWVGSGAVRPGLVADPQLTGTGVQWRVGVGSSSYLVRREITSQGCQSLALRGSDALQAAASAQDDDTTYVIDAPRRGAGTAASTTLTLRAIAGVAFGGLPAVWRHVEAPRSQGPLLRPAARSSAARCLLDQPR